MTKSLVLLPHDLPGIERMCWSHLSSHILIVKFMKSIMCHGFKKLVVIRSLLSSVCVNYKDDVNQGCNMQVYPYNRVFYCTQLRVQFLLAWKQTNQLFFCLITDRFFLLYFIKSIWP